MRCPYCVSAVDEQALVCPVCRRDIYLFKSLVGRIQLLEERLDELRRPTTGATTSTTVMDSDAARLASGAAVPSGTEASSVNDPKSATRTPTSGLMICVGAAGVLVVAHFLLVIACDLPAIHLRIAALVLPLPFGFWLRLRSSFGKLARLMGALLVAVVSVAIMSLSTGLSDHTNLLPASTVEWREFIEFALSIACSFLTGNLLAAAIQARAASGPLAARIFRLLTKVLGVPAGDPAALEITAKRLEALGSTLMALGTTYAGMYVGLRALLGSH